MEVLLLGGLEVLGDDGAPVAVPGAKLRALLALLALGAGRVVPIDRLVDDLWRDDDQPTDVANALQRLVSKLRRTLPSPDAIATRAPGYMLVVEAGAVDVYRVELLAAAARSDLAAGNLERAVDQLQAADALWRGEALADFAYEPFARPHITRLEELRVSLIEDRVEAELALGRHSELVVGLEALVAQHPLRERLRRQLMLALYRCGRQADALRVFQEGRTVLADELGLDPGPELRALEAAILDQSPALLLDAVPRAAVRVASPAARTNVKAALTPLVGRDAELAELTTLLAGERLLTLVGPGGAGKTRLANEVARLLADRCDDGAFVAELAPVGDPNDVPRAAVDALDLPESDTDATTRLRAHCRDRDLLLVLDNCEHVLDAAAQLTEDLLGTCRAVRIIATSREPLRVDGEVVWPVPPLETDDAIELFAQRAHAAHPAFALDDAALPVIAEVVGRLDGLPLAIELAAARTRAFGVDQLRDALGDRFRLLTSGPRTALPRHRTLRAVVDWSYDLLFDDERRVFERLSVFPAGCDLAAAQATCADHELDAGEVIEVVASLVDKSLLTVDRAARPPRYVMLQTLAEYGRERLVERGEADGVLRRMAEHYADISDIGAAAQRGLDQRAWLVGIADEYDNLRAALDWAVLSGEGDVALRIATGTAWQRWIAGTANEGCRWLDEALAIADAAPPLLRAAALRWRAYLGFLAIRSESFDELFEEAAAIEAAHGDRGEAALTLAFHAQIVNEQGRYGRAAELTAEALDVLATTELTPWTSAAATWLRATLAALRDGDHVAFEKGSRAAIDEFVAAGDELMAAITRGVVAEFDERRGDYAAATAQIEQALAFTTAMRVGGFHASLLARLAGIHVHAGELDAADELLARSMPLAEDLAYAPVRAQSLLGIANVRRRQGRLDDAERAAREALALYQGTMTTSFDAKMHAALPGRPIEAAATQRAFDSPIHRTGLGVPAGRAAALSVLGFVAEARDDAATARARHRAALDEMLITRDARGMALALEGLAGAAVLDGDGAGAARLLGHASALRESDLATAGADEHFDIDRAAAAARTAIGDAAYDDAFAAGRAASLTELLGELGSG
jgi:predicted ATPase/DNA-binding SARP family transcriptional activator